MENSEEGLACVCVNRSKKTRKISIILGEESGHGPFGSSHKELLRGCHEEHMVGQHHVLHPTHRVLPCEAFRWSDLCI